MHVFLGAVGGVVFALSLSLLLRLLDKAAGARQASYLYVAAGMIVGLACFALVIQESLLAGVIAAAATLLVRTLVRHRPRSRPDYVVGGVVLKDSVSPQLTVKLIELEERARNQRLQPETTAEND
jgi:NhaP-type Na+/H+ or K+/H+ antiporter